MNPIAIKEGVSLALTAVQILRAIAVTNGNVQLAAQEMSDELAKVHAEGRTMSPDELLAFMAKGDQFEAEALARARAAMQRPG